MRGFCFDKGARAYVKYIHTKITHEDYAIQSRGKKKGELHDGHNRIRTNEVTHPRGGKK